MHGQRSLTARVLLGTLIALFGCSDSPSDSPTAPTHFPQLGEVEAPVVCTEQSPAVELIGCLFDPAGNATAARSRYESIVRFADAGDAEKAAKHMFDLVDFTLKKKDQGKLLDPQPLGQDVVVSLLLDELFRAAGLEPPDIPEGALGDDGAVAIVTPEGATVVPGTKLVGAHFAEGAFEQDALVVFERLPDGEGPLPTDLDQYGPFYGVTINPAPQEIPGVDWGQCYYDDGPLAPPADPALRDNLRLARTVPGTTDEIKILGWAPAPSYIDCSDVTQIATLGYRNTSRLAALGHAVSSFLEKALSPEPLLAGPTGGQTDTILIRGAPSGAMGPASMLIGTVSTYVEPGPLPDLIVESITVLTPTPREGALLELQVVVENIGLGSAGSSDLTLVLQGTDPANYFQAPASYPGLGPGESYARVISGQVDADDYHATAAADAPGQIVEDDEYNNSTTITFTVAEPLATVWGTVRYSTTALAGITTELLSVSDPGTPLAITTTDAAGRYAFTYVEPGSYLVKIYGGGEYVDWITSGVDVADVDVVRDLWLPKKIVLQSPTDGATVLSTQPTLTWAANAEAQAGGDYIVTVRETATWTLVDEGYVATNSYQVQTPLTDGVDYTWQVSARDSGARRVGNTVDPFTFVVQELNTITGQVLVDGEPAAGATLHLTGPMILSVMTSAAGTYAVTNLVDGVYTLSVTGYIAEFSRSPKSVSVSGGVTVVDFSGAYLHTSPSGTGTADSWTVAEPAGAVNLCNGEGTSACVGTTWVRLSAVATGPTGTFMNPWLGGYVYFYYRDAVTGLHTYVGRVNGSFATVIDDGTTRFWTWSLDLDGAGIPAGPLEVLAVGVDGGGSGTRTPVSSTNITVVEGT